MQPFYMKGFVLIPKSVSCSIHIQFYILYDMGRVKLRALTSFRVSYKRENLRCCMHRNIK